MKIIDLLNKIANGEEVPEKIMYDNKQYTLYNDKEYYDFEDKGLFENLFSQYGTDIILNYWIKEIIDHKVDIEIEKLEIGEIVDDKIIGLRASINLANKEIEDKINELIDEVKQLKEEK